MTTMPDAPMSDLLGAVRRRLWWDRGVAAVRLAAWGTAGLMLLGTAAHVIVRPLPIGAVAAAAALWCTALLVRAALQRPSDAHCALWADCHLGGQSGFTTWLEVERESARDRDRPAHRLLEQWVAARVPQALHRLDQARDPSRVARPLTAMIVCAALTMIVFSLPELGLSPPPTPRASTAPSSEADRPAAIAAAPSSNELVREVASALRSSSARAGAERRSGTGSSTAAADKLGQAGDTPAAAANAPPGQASAASGSATDNTAIGRGSPVVGSGSGREAGDSRDLRADPGTSRATPRALPMPRSAAPARAPAAESQANPELAGRFDDDAAATGVERASAEPAVMAATPPAATDSLRLTPTQNHYVQAWLSAGTRRP